MSDSQNPISSEPKKDYQKPQLLIYGNLRDITQFHQGPTQNEDHVTPMGARVKSLP